MNNIIETCTDLLLMCEMHLYFDVGKFNLLGHSGCQLCANGRIKHLSSPDTKNPS